MDNKVTQQKSEIDLSPVGRVCVVGNKTAVSISLPSRLTHNSAVYTGEQVKELEARAFRDGERVGLADAHEERLAEVRDFEKRLNGVYFERNQLAIALARLTLVHSDWPMVGIDPPAGYGFDAKTGRAVVYVDLPSGHQVSWHMDDDTTEFFKRGKSLPLPPYSGEWDGTFLGREHGWPRKYVCAEQSIDIEPFPFVLAGSGQGVEQVGTVVQEALTHSVKIDSFAVRVAGAPEGATHYRNCSAGKKRFYHLDPVTGWHYFHADAGIWYPTDLSADYLEGHLHPVVCASAVLDEITNAIRESQLSVDLTSRVEAVSKESLCTAMHVESESQTRAQADAALSRRIDELARLTGLVIGPTPVRGPRISRYNVLRRLALDLKAKRAEHGACHAHYWLDHPDTGVIAYRITDAGAVEFFEQLTGEWALSTMSADWVKKAAVPVVD